MLDDKTLLDQEPEENLSEDTSFTGDVATPSDIAETTLNEPADDPQEPSASSVIDAVLESNDVDVTDQSGSVKHADIITPTEKEEPAKPVDKDKKATAVDPSNPGNTNVSSGEPNTQTVIQSNSNTTTEIRTTSHTENRIESHPSTIINLTVNQPVAEGNEEPRVNQTSPAVPGKVIESNTIEKTSKTIEQKAPEAQISTNQTKEPEKSQVNQAEQSKQQEQSTNTASPLSPSELAIQDEVNKMDIFNLFGLSEPTIKSADATISPSSSALAAASKGEPKTEEAESVKTKSTEPATPSAIVNPLTGEPDVISEEEKALREVFTSLTDPTASWLTGSKPSGVIENTKAPTSPSITATESAKTGEIATKLENTEASTKSNAPVTSLSEQKVADMTPAAITKAVNQPEPINQNTENTSAKEAGTNTPTDIIEASVNTTNSKNSNVDEVSEAGRVEANQLNTSDLDKGASSDQAEVKSNNPRTDVPLLPSPEIRVDHKANALTPAIVKNILTSTETKSLNSVNESLVGVKSALEAVKEATINNSNTTNSTSNSTMLVNNVEAAKSAQAQAASAVEVKKEEPPKEEKSDSGLTEFYLHAIYDALVSQGIKIKSYG